MNKIFKSLSVGILALALVFTFGVSSANAALTLGALTVVSDGALTVTTAVGSAGSLFDTTTTGNLTMGAALTTGNLTLGGAQTSGTITIGGGVQTGTITLGGGTGAQTVNVGTGATGAKTINIGTSAVANVLTLGNVTGATSVTVNTGTGGFAVNTTSTGDITLTTADDFSLIGASGSVLTLGTSDAGILFNEETEDVAGDNTLTAAESGKTLYMGTAGEDQTLPAPTDGVWYRFVVQANVATTNMTITGPAADATDDKIYGTVEVAGAAVLCSAEDTLTFVADTNEAIPGDWVELHSDGTNWYISGQVATASAFTCTDAD